MKRAKRMGFQTWVSLEPVIDPAEALVLIEAMHPYIDVWKVGRWNHDARAKSIDWAGFAVAALDLLEQVAARYYIKDELWKSAGRAVVGRTKANCGA